MAVRLEWDDQGIVNVESGRRYGIDGRFSLANGLVKFDGFTTGITISGADAAEPAHELTIAAWIAPQAYPWNWCSIVGRDREDGRGFQFGIDAEGRIGLRLFADEGEQLLVSDTTIPFMTAWSHVAASLDSNGIVRLLINGKVAAESRCEGTPDLAAGEPILIGRNGVARAPAALVREWLAIPSILSFDGLIDRVEIYGNAFAPDEVAAMYLSLPHNDPPPLEWRKLPGLRSNGTFRAYYTRLEFYPEWDALWRVGDHPDIVVEFPNGRGHAVFWRGTNFNMNLVTENGKWVGDQSAETGGNWELSQGPVANHATGCMEHMSDKQNRFAHVRIIENTPARVVVHWRYALVDVLYRIAETDPETGWGTWADEYYYIYPNGTCVRSACVHGSGGEYSLTEPATFNQPGETAEDNVETAAVSVLNMSGESDTYRWSPWPKVSVKDANICVVNFKSEMRPFYVFEEGAYIGPYGAPAEQRPDYSLFPTWNHWPVAQVASDGRYALAPDRVSSSAVLSPDAGFTIDKEGRSRARFLLGLTGGGPAGVLPLARSWLSPPPLACANDAFTYEGYSRDQCAFLLARTGDGPLSCTISATAERPLVDPVVVVRGWDGNRPQVMVDQTTLEPGTHYRFGLTNTLEGIDLVLAFALREQHEVSLTVE